MEYRIVWERDSGRPVVEIHGPLMPLELQGMVGALWADPRYAAARHGTWDFSACETHYHFDDIFNLIGYVREHKADRGPGVVAVVAPRDIEFGMTRMFATLSETAGPRVQVFRTREQARAWLDGLDVAGADPA